jgi:hypothetical protein
MTAAPEYVKHTVDLALVMYVWFFPEQCDCCLGIINEILDLKAGQSGK